MVLSWTRRIAFRRAHKHRELPCTDMEITIPAHFKCPISLDLMKDPVTLSTGITYDRESIEKWIESGNRTCPVTNQPLRSFDQIPNHSIRRMIQDWCVQNRSYGIERIPTPRIPVTPYQVSDACSKISAVTQKRDALKCKEYVGKLKTWGKESERNKRCIVENGAGFVLCDAFETFTGERNVGLLEEIVGVLVWMFPMGEVGQSRLGSEESLNAIVWLLNDNDLSLRQNASLVLKELVCLDKKHIDGLVRVDGIAGALVNMIREPIGHIATKSCLTTIFHMISSHKERIGSRFVELGLVNLLLEILVDAERGMCEKALGVLDGICDSEDGKEMVKRNALAMPLLVKKIFRVSELASEFSVSIIWKLCDKGKGDEDLMVEAIKVGAFQKLLVLLQVGCGMSTKEKATEVLKLLNFYKGRVECVDSSLDLKHLKKPF